MLCITVQSVCAVFGCVVLCYFKLWHAICCVIHLTMCCALIYFVVLFLVVSCRVLLWCVAFCIVLCVALLCFIISSICDVNILLICKFIFRDKRKRRQRYFSMKV